MQGSHKALRKALNYKTDFEGFKKPYILVQGLQQSLNVNWGQKLLILLVDTFNYKIA